MRSKIGQERRDDAGDDRVLDRAARRRPPARTASAAWRPTRPRCPGGGCRCRQWCRSCSPVEDTEHHVRVADVDREQQRAHTGPRRSVTSPGQHALDGARAAVRRLHQKGSLFVDTQHRSDHLAGDPRSADAHLRSRHSERISVAVQDRRERARAQPGRAGPRVARAAPRRRRRGRGTFRPRCAGWWRSRAAPRAARPRRRFTFTPMPSTANTTRLPSKCAGRLMPLVLRPSISTSLGHLISTAQRSGRFARAVSATATAAANTWRGTCSGGIAGRSSTREVEAAAARREEAAPEPAAARGLAVGDHERAVGRALVRRASRRTGSWSRSRRRLRDARRASASRALARRACGPFQRDVGGRGRVGERADRDLVDSGARDRGDGRPA